MEQSRWVLTTSESILEDLLETQELQDGKIDSGVEPQTTLVGAESRVKLDTVTPVDMELSLVVLPDNTELDDTLGNGDNGKALLEFGVNLEKLRGLESGDKLAVGLLEFWLSWVVGHFDRGFRRKIAGC